ncbi:MAG: DNA/RNA non-specific endonuclease [Clostridia bacterium]|nr:DNA/RNA non-specific endonuclease [Clostridia bacterium]
MKKRITALLALIFIIIASLAPAGAAGLDGFVKSPARAARFTDVSADHWAYARIYDCAAYGLMEGFEDGSFRPEESLTVIQAVIMADRVNEIYETGRSTLENGDPWYAPYLEYAEEHTIIYSGEYADTAAPATRAQMAHIFYNALPEEAYSLINDVSLSDIPDVNARTPYAREIERLYGAGILNGGDARGTFFPDSRITRAEAAAIITRAVDISARVSVSAKLPVYTGEPYVVLSGGVPELFADASEALSPFEYYSELDGLGRCGTAYANVCREIMPDEPRGEIGMVKPSGWHTVRYDDLISDKYLYNRCHLIAFMLAGENANEKNLITGTRYLNIEGMLPFENVVANYVKRTNNHVLYRVTPVFEGENLVASGVQIEALSVEDSGAGVMFNVYCFNVQPGVIIDYKTGDSTRDPNYVNPSTAAGESEGAGGRPAAAQNPDESVVPDTSGADYIANKNTGVFHYPSCPSVGKMAEKNKVYLNGTREDAIAAGYRPCGSCKP